MYRETENQFDTADALYLGLAGIITEKKEACLKRRGDQQRKKPIKGLTLLARANDPSQRTFKRPSNAAAAAYSEARTFPPN